MKRAEANRVRSKRRLHIGHPVIQRAAHVGTVGIRHEHKAPHTAGEQGSDELVNRCVVERMPQMRPEIGAHRLKQPLWHQMRVHVDEWKWECRGRWHLTGRGYS